MTHETAKSRSSLLISLSVSPLRDARLICCYELTFPLFQMYAFPFPRLLSQQKPIDHPGLKVHCTSMSNKLIAYILSKPVNRMSKRFLANENTSRSLIFEACVPAVDTVTQEH